MERYRVASSFNGSLQQKPTSLSSLPPKSLLLKDPTIAPFNLHNTSLSGSRADEKELNIFDAESYFSEVHEGVQPTMAVNAVATRDRDSSSVLSLDGYGRYCRQGSIVTTPTASSVASWNSETGLLSRHSNAAVVLKHRDMSAKQIPRSPSTSGRRRFGRKCPCSGKKSVDIEEKYSEPKSPISLKFEPNISTNCGVAKKPSAGPGEWIYV